MQQKFSDSNNNCKNCQEIDIDVQQALPCILHKKHKVIKLIKNHLEHVNQAEIFANISAEQEIANTTPTEPTELPPSRKTTRALSRAEAGSVSRGGVASGGGGGGGGEELNVRTRNGRGKKFCFCAFIILLLTTLLILLIMVYISVGPVSLSIPHTPINPNTFLRTDCLCSLEKKYLLRWSKPECFD